MNSFGAFALSENYLYTVEAFRDYLRELDIVVKRRPSAADLADADLPRPMM